MLTTQPENFSYLDTAFARFLGSLTPLAEPEKAAFENIVKKLSFEQNQGHNCIALNKQESELIRTSGLAMNSANSDEPLLPLVLEEQRLYLQRYWHYEQRLAQQISAMSQCQHTLANLETLLSRYFTDTSIIPDWQREAAQLAITRSFAVITGGPGTGKTTTVVKILALLQELSPQPLLIALTAPTGKAAMRLQESIGRNKAQLPCSLEIAKQIPETVTTLHRLLGAKPPSPYFRHDAEKPLVYDVVVVDEASMVDLALISKLVDALKPQARLILLGDKDQLASVESGAVLADLIAALPTHTVELRHTYRFNENIKALAVAINDGQAAKAWRMLQQGNANCALLRDEVINYIAAQQIEYLHLIKKGAAITDIFQAFNRFQALCSNRQGKNSVAEVNYYVEQRLAEQRKIVLSGTWYVGRPVLITQNNAALHLYNGDIGLCLPDAEQGGKLMVFFQQPDGSIKKYLPNRITACETVFAMTIHKSQGSEFEEVCVLLPETSNAVLTKELLYTAITRAKETVKIVATQAVFSETVQRKVERVTGLVACCINNCVALKILPAK